MKIDLRESLVGRFSEIVLTSETLEEWQKLGDMKLWLGTSSDESKLDSKSRTLSIELHDAEMAREIFYEEEAE